MTRRASETTVNGRYFNGNVKARRGLRRAGDARPQCARKREFNARTLPSATAAKRYSIVSTSDCNGFNDRQRDVRIYRAQAVTRPPSDRWLGPIARSQGPSDLDRRWMARVEVLARFVLGRSRLVPGRTLLGARRGRRFSHKRSDLACKGPILATFGVRENGRELPPRIKRCLTAKLNEGAGCCRPPLDPQPAFISRLHLPEFVTIAAGPTAHLPRRFSIDSALAQLIGEDLSPAAQIRLAQIEPLAVLRLGFDRQVDMRICLMIVQHHHVAMIGELDLRELSGREKH